MNENNEKTNYIRLFFLICLIILVVTVVYFLLVNTISSKTTDCSTTRGTFGDMFGGLNAVFSGFAFAGVIITILMQMKELELTRDELRKSVEAQDKSQQALNLQLKNMEITTKIESVKNIIETFSEHNESDKKEVAKLILNHLVEDTFYAAEYIEFVKPSVSIKDLPILRGPRMPRKGINLYEDYDEKRDDNQIIIKFVNTGASFNIKRTKIENPEFEYIRINYYKEEKKKLSSGGTAKSVQNLKNDKLVERKSEFFMSINNVKNFSDLKFIIFIEGNFVKHQYELIVNLKRNGPIVFSETSLNYIPNQVNKINSSD